MKEVQSLSIQYIGYKEPQTHEEVELEILGLHTAISVAKQRIAVLTQSVMLQNIMKESMAKDNSNEETVEKASEPEKTE